MKKSRTVLAMAAALAFIASCDKVKAGKEYEERGMREIKEGKTAEGIKHLRKASDRIPDDPKILNELGAALAGAGRTDEAITMLEEATKRRAVDADGFFLLGELLDSQGKLSEANYAFEGAKFNDPQNLKYLKRLGRMYLRRELFDNAAVTGMEILAVDPEEREGMYIAGMGFLEKRDLARASVYIPRLVIFNKNPTQEQLFAYARLETELGIYDAAEKAFALVSPLKVDPAGFYLYRGMLKINTGRRDDALGDFRKAMENDPKGKLGKRAKALLNEALVKEPPRK
jgi:tetratricopeptide (TPR) repeat protein